MHPFGCFGKFEPLLALLEKYGVALKKHHFIFVPELSVPAMALAVSEPSSPGAEAGTDAVSVPCRPECLLDSTGSHCTGKSFLMAIQFIIIIRV